MKAPYGLHLLSLYVLWYSFSDVVFGYLNFFSSSISLYILVLFVPLGYILTYFMLVHFYLLFVLDLRLLKRGGWKAESFVKITRYGSLK